MRLYRSTLISRRLVLTLAVAACALAQQPKLPPETYTQPERIVAIGDIHGDFDTFTLFTL